MKWFKEYLPDAPTSVLVAACGAGREMEGLIDLGYIVDGFDGSESMVTQARERLPDANIRLATFKSMIDQSVKFNSDYDAVVVGWGSIMHIYDDEELALFIQHLDLLCKTGPILLSGGLSKNIFRSSVSQRWVVNFADYVSSFICILLKRKKNSDHVYEKYTVTCLLYTSPSPRDKRQSRMPSSA